MIKNSWNDKQANKFVKQAGKDKADQELALRVYTSCLIGSNPDLVMHGGGNTSVKVERKNLFGEIEKVLHVKGSGWDLGTIEAPGLPGVRIEPLYKLRQLNTLSDEDMVNVQRCNLLDSTSPNPSVETLLHAYLPHKYVDHTHATPFLTLANLPNVEKLMHEIFGNKLALVPYIMPGFALAKTAAEVFEANPKVEGLLLKNHGHFTFGDTAKESYDKVIEHTNILEKWLQKRAKKVPNFASVGVGKPVKEASTVLTQLRGALSDAQVKLSKNLDAPMPILELRCGKETMRILGRADIKKLASFKVGTPDHVIRIKNKPLLATKAQIKQGRKAFDELIKQFVADYKKFFKQGVKKYPEGRTMVSPLPATAWLPGIGIVGIGASSKQAKVAADLAEQSLQIWDVAADLKLGDVDALSDQDLFDMEYWSLEQAKLGKSKPPKLHSKVVMITGGAGALGQAIAKSFANAGCEIFLVDLNKDLLQTACSKFSNAGSFVCDVTKKGIAEEAIKKCIEKFGGLDILISNAGAAWSGEMVDLDEAQLRKSFELNYFAHRSFCIAAAKLMIEQGRGGQIIANVSKQAVNPGKGFGAYGMPKAATMFLVKQLALELGGHGIRVNGMNPDRIRSGLLTDDFIAERADARGVTVEEYMGNNLLKREVEAHHVGDAFVAMATSDRTTAHIMTVDGGNIEASLR